MSLFGFFSKSGQVERLRKNGSNIYAQPDVRRSALQKLLDTDTVEAREAALARFTVNATGAISDEEEKRWLVDELVNVGEPAVPALQAYLRREKNLAFPLQALERIAGVERALGEVVAVLERYPPDDYRSDEIKLQLIHYLGEHRADARVLPAVSAYLEDHSDDVRYAVLELVEAQGAELKEPPDEATRVRLGALLFLTDARPRIMLKAATLLADREWQVPGDRTDVAPSLDEQFFVDKKGFVRRRPPKTARKETT